MCPVFYLIFPDSIGIVHHFVNDPKILIRTAWNTKERDLVKGRAAINQ